MNDLLERYAYQFKELPTLVPGSSYGDSAYVKLMENALAKNIPISDDDIEREFPSEGAIMY